MFKSILKVALLILYLS